MTFFRGYFILEFDFGTTFIRIRAKLRIFCKIYRKETIREPGAECVFLFARRPVLSETSMQCPYCGAALSAQQSHRFCGHCGAALGYVPPSGNDAREEGVCFLEPTDPPRPHRTVSADAGDRQYGENDGYPPPRQSSGHSENQQSRRHGEYHGEHRSNGRHGSHHHGAHHHSGHHHGEHRHSEQQHRGKHENGGKTGTSERTAFSYRLAKTVLISAIAVTLSLLVIIGLFADPITSFSVSWFRPESGKLTVPLQILGIAERNLFRMRSFDFDVSYEDTIITGTVEWGADLLSSKAAISIKQGNDKTVAYYNNERLLIVENDKRVSGFSMRMLLSMLNDPSDTFFDDMIRLFEQKGVNRAYPNWNEEVQRLSDAFYKCYDLIGNHRPDRETLFSLANDITRFVFPMIVHNSPYKTKKNYSSEEEIPDFQKLLEFTVEFFTNHLSQTALKAKRAGAGTNITYNMTVDPGAASRDLLEFIDQDDYFQAFCRAYGASSTAILTKIDFKDSRERFARSPIHVQTVMRHGYLNSITASANGESILRIGISHKNTARVNPKDYAYIEDLRTADGVQDDYQDDPYNAVMAFLQKNIKEVPA